jgi:hypothetical protein
MKHIFDHVNNTIIKAVPLVEASRDNDLGPLMVDIAYRDVGDNKESINIIIYRRHDVHREKVEPYILKTCKDIFHSPKDLDLIYRDEAEIQHKLKLNGKVHQFDSWFIEIKYPRSLYYSVSGLTEVFLNTLNKNLCGM